MKRRLSSTHRIHGAALAACAVALIGTALLSAQAQQTAGGTLERIRAQGRIKFGYRADARPFAYVDESGQAAGYSVALCQAIADGIAREPGLEGTKADWVPVRFEDRFAVLQEGRIDVLCGADTITLTRRAQASFSVPIFPGGVGGIVRADAPARLREVLAGRAQPFHPVWRASASQVLQARAFSAVQGTTADSWLSSRARDLGVIAGVSHVDSYDAGIQALLARKTDVFFGERAVLLATARSHASAKDLLVLDRAFTYEPLALAFGRGDEAFRLVVDRALTRVYSSGEINGLYTKWFGEPDETAIAFFRWNTLPE